MNQARFNYEKHLQQRPEQQGHVIAVIHDRNDGHKRVTISEQFSIIGGSQDAHGFVTGVLLRICESLERQGKSVSDASQEEIESLLRKHSTSEGT